MRMMVRIAVCMAEASMHMHIGEMHMQMHISEVHISEVHMHVCCMVVHMHVRMIEVTQETAASERRATGQVGRAWVVQQARAGTIRG
jgi:hypothetical protein